MAAAPMAVARTARAAMLEPAVEATFDETLQSWLIVGYASDTKTTGEHRLVCVGDVVSSSDDEDDNNEDA